MPETFADTTFDVVVIGAGTAGLNAFRTAAARTDNVCLVESGVHGTMCARVGCMPSKLLIAAADAAEHARHAKPFGIDVSHVSVDGPAVMDRLRRERDRFVGFVVADVDKIPASKRITGRARFVSRDTIAVGERRIRARAFVIATGSRPIVPENFRALGDRAVINDDVFAWETLPESVVVFGGGVIGLELGQALSRLGVRVSIYGRKGRVGQLTDPEVCAEAIAILRAEVPFFPDASLASVSREGDAVVVVVNEESAAPRRETYQFALVATGRKPAVQSLGLETTGLALDDDGVPLFDRTTLQCGDSSIFVAGDLANDTPLLHEATDEGNIAGENAARYPDVQSRARRSGLAITFTDPQLATVGSSFAELANRDDIVIGEVKFDDQGRSRIMLVNRGLLRLYVEAGTGRLLGAEMAAPRAEHLGHLLAWAHQQRLTVDQMLSMPFYHPVVEEGVRTALRNARDKLLAKRS